MNKQRNIKLIIEYDGTDYAGWQYQENAPTIQNEIEKALNLIIHEDVNVIGAGRTDAGVHARGQVANVKIFSSIPCDKLQRALNGVLPKDIVILNVEEVPNEFHARFSATSRYYTYTISTKPSALERRYCWYVKYPLKIDDMQKTASMILGSHDFSSFCRANSDVDHHYCTVMRSEWSLEFNKFIYHIKADRFLHGMVRALVGTMVEIGRGYTSSDEFIQILSQHDRKKAGITAPAKGLILEGVFYDT